MKDLFKNTIALLLVTLVLGAMPTDAEGEIYGDTIRLHILANSDSEDDQALKLRLRDYILEKYSERLRTGGSVDEAKKEIQCLLPTIEEDAKQKLNEWGYSYDLRVSLSQEWYETREYKDFRLPAGYYSSLRVIIGNGEGQNWWCVMYPPLCTEIATERAPADDGVIDYTKEEVLLIKSGKYNVKFKILEELSRLFEKNG